MKKALLLIALLLAAMLLAGCASQESTQFPETGAALQVDPLSVAASANAERPPNLSGPPFSVPRPVTVVCLVFSWCAVSG